MKTFIIGLVCFLAGIAVWYGWTQYMQLRLDNAQLQRQVAEVQTSPTETIDRMEGIKDENEPGSAEGTLGYPSEMIPRLLVYAINVNDPSKPHVLETEPNTPKFIMNGLPPGTYHFVAYLQSNPDQRGGYSKAVPCGLSVNCTDHSLIDVKVEAGQTVQNVDIKDWYAPEGTFPAKPN